MRQPYRHAEGGHAYIRPWGRALGTPHDSTLHTAGGAPGIASLRSVRVLLKLIVLLKVINRTRHEADRPAGIRTHRTSPFLIMSVMALRLTRKPALARASSRMLASTEVRRSSRGAATRSSASGTRRGCTLTLRTCRSSAADQLLPRSVTVRKRPGRPPAG